MTDLGSPDPPRRGIGAALLVFALGALAFAAWWAWPRNDPAGEPPFETPSVVAPLSDTIDARGAPSPDTLAPDAASPPDST